MAEARRRRTLRTRIAVWTAAAVLFLACYFGSWLVYVFALGAGWLPPGWPKQSARLVYAPIEIYIIEDYPGAQTLRDIARATAQAGYRHVNG
jgi:hypothetical protein